MKTIKRFIVWVNYGLEGWSIFGSSDDWDEAVSIRSEAIDECNIDEEDIILAENKNELVVKPAAKQMTEWHRELEAVLMTLDDCQMECDGMTWAVSHLLNDAGDPCGIRPVFLHSGPSDGIPFPRGGWRYGCCSVRHDAVVDQVRQRGSIESLWHGDGFTLPCSCVRETL